MPNPAAKKPPPASLDQAQLHTQPPVSLVFFSLDTTTFAFRNIIHPNCGFWRQLRDLEVPICVLVCLVLMMPRLTCHARAQPVGGKTIGSVRPL